MDPSVYRTKGACGVICFFRLLFSANLELDDFCLVVSRVPYKRGSFTVSEHVAMWFYFRNFSDKVIMNEQIGIFL